MKRLGLQPVPPPKAPSSSQEQWNQKHVEASADFGGALRVLDKQTSVISVQPLTRCVMATFISVGTNTRTRCSSCAMYVTNRKLVGSLCAKALCVMPA